MKKPNLPGGWVSLFLPLFLSKQKGSALKEQEPKEIDFDILNVW